MDARELLEELRRQQDRADRVNASPGQAAAQGGAEQLVGNLLGIPEFAARGVRGASNLVRGATGQDMIPIPPEGLLGLPSGREALAGVESVPNLLGLDAPGYEENLARRNAVERDEGMAHTLGSVGADVATLAAGRSPFVKGSGGFFDKPIASAIDDFARSTKSNTGLKAFTRDIMDSELFRSVARGLGRSTEAGIEGIALASIQNGDPADAAAMAAGSQMASSLALTAANEAVDFPSDVLGTPSPKTLKGKLGALVINAAIYGGLMQFAKTAFPGGDDRILESQEAGYDKILGTMLIGGVLGVSGKRSLPDGAFKAFPKFADALNTIPRASVQSAIVDWSKDEDAQQVIDTIIRHPGAFNSQQTDQLLEALQSGDLSKVKSLTEQEDFRRILEGPDPRLGNVPEKK